MAELITSPAKGARKGRKKLSTRVDLTPMVDLGFLLITFFMYTTTLAQPKAMEINMPDKTDHAPNKMAYVEESTITVIPTHSHKVICYNGTLKNGQSLFSTGFEATHGLRDILINKAKEAAALPAKFSLQAHQLHVIIKPDSDCTYDDVVQIFDEMNILNVPYYAMTDITPEEKAWMENFKAGAYGKF